MTDAPAQNVPIQLSDGQVNPTWYERLQEIFSGWKAYAPAITSQTGTITSASASGRYKKIGKTVHFSVQITITTNGTAATSLVIPLPAEAGPIRHAVAGHDATSVLGLTGLINASATTILLMKFDGSYPGANGKVLVVSGTYEAAK